MLWQVPPLASARLSEGPLCFFQALTAGATAGAEPLAGTRSCARVAAHLSAAMTPLLATSPLLPRISIPRPASPLHAAATTDSLILRL